MTGLTRAAACRLLGLCGLLLSCRTTPVAPATPPVAPQRAATWTLHGQAHEDPFLWMRNAEDPALLDYVRAENTYAQRRTAHLAPLRRTLAAEILGHIQRTDESVPARLGAYRYWDRIVDGKDHPIHLRQKDGGQPEVLLDVNELAGGRASFSIPSHEVNTAQTMLAYLVDEDGSERHHVLFKDLVSGTVIDDNIRDAGGSLAFTAAPRTVLYTRLNASMRSYCVMRHVVGSPSADDVLVHEEKDPRLELSIHKTLDDAFILIHGQGTTTTEVWAVDARDNAAPFLVAPRKENVTQMVEHGQGRFFLLTNEGAPNFKLLTSTDPAQVAWRDLVPHRPDISMSEMVVMDGAVVLLAREDAVPHWRLVDVATGKEKVVRLDSPAHMLMPGVNLEASAPAFRFGSASFTQAGSTLEVDLRTGLVRTLKTRHVPGYDATRYQEQRLNVVSADGAVIPVVVVAARGTPRDGTAPGLLTAYGAYGIAMDPAFDPSLLPLLDRGMVVVLAQVRGGDERGGAWRDGGRLKEKHHTFEDVITVAQALHKDGWVARNRLALRGGSAGGLLVGAVINLRPDLFAAAVAEVPFVDVLHTMLDADAPLTAQEYEEWGNPNEPEAFAVMAAYSPYDNLKPQDHPAMLVTAGINDPRVRFFEAARYVAKLRTLKTDRNVVLLKVLMDSGHSGVTGLNAAAEEEAWVQAFLMEALAMAH